MKTDLFRFATLRAPQLISPGMKKIGYINHPKISDSVFLKSITDTDDIDQARKKVREIRSHFNATKSTNSIKDINEQLYIFSSWLMLNKNTLTQAEALKKSEHVNGLNLSQQVFLWDNVFYQILTKESDYVRQACIQMLVASNFLKQAKNESEIKKTAKTITIPRLPIAPEGDRQIDLFLRRLANAKLIIPYAFTIKKEDKADEKYEPKDDFTRIEIDFDKNYLLHQVSFLENARSDLSTFNKVYRKDYHVAMKKAMDDYDKIVYNINKDYFDKISINDKKNTTSDSLKTLNPDERLFLNYPNFNFEFDAPFSEKYVKGKLNAPALEWVRNQHLQDQPVETAILNIDRQIKSLKKQAYSHLQKSQKIFVTNGNVIKEEKLKLYAYAIKFANEENINELNNKMFMAINVGYKNAYIIFSNYKIKSGDKTLTGKVANIIRNSDKVIFMELFPDEKLNMEAKFFEINGEFELSNGVNLVFESKGYLKNKYTHGIAKAIAEKSEESDDIHYGVNHIGIADYRKVEQEVCCYVPGEVSHIENILAREYKERHTRNLTSTESTTELTSEVEIENLTDTSTTERNELHTETSTILNEDRSSNFGFSAGVSGSYAGVTVSANAFADFASSNSSSDSNSEAKTYAEDVTRRALERVVQKITQKRVSKILKEYEENNRHGFDNRNGDQHVTGIYRWVDKIYKNRLVNFGKRLMYEFLIPEPARFYRTAISTILQNEEETTEQSTVITVPPSPADLGFTGPADINEDNYQGFAAAYEVSVDAPPREKDTISHSVSVKPDPDTKPFSFSINDLMIEDGYEAVEATANMTFVYDRALVGGPDARFVMNLGGQNFSRTYTNRDQTTKNIANTFIFSSPIKTKVSGSISGDKIVSAGVDIVVSIERTDKLYDEWKNKAYDVLIAAYNAKLQEHEADMQAAGINESDETEKPKTNPQFNRITEQREIKRICIEMLTGPFNIPVGKNYYRTVSPCDNNPTEIHSVKQNPSFDRYTSHVKFFEQAFDWEIMSYIFYPYYWADKCKWIELFQSTDANDPVFQSFLQSGMARVIVPVREGFEQAVPFFMETGDIWNGGGLVLDDDSDLYLSIVEEMQEVEGVVEEEWQTTVPTSLTIVQNQSAQLDEGGLPCCEEAEGADKIKTSDVTISIPES